MKKKITTQILKKKTSNALKADRAIHRVILSLMTELSLCQELFHSFLTRQLVVTQTMSTVNNVTRALVDRLTVKFAGEIAQDTDGYDLFKLFEDLFLTENERTSMFREGIQSDDLSKIRCYAEDMKKSGDVKENKFIDVYQNKCGIPLRHSEEGVKIIHR